MELTLEQALQKGIEAHRAGKAQEADRYYTAILRANPKHPDANHNMGVLAVGYGKVNEALPFFKNAIAANPKIAQYWLSYIDALIKLDRISDAKAVFNQAKSKGTTGDAFDQIEQKLNTPFGEVKNHTQQGIPVHTDILDELKLDQAIELAKKNLKDGLNEEAKKIYQDILKKFPKNKKALDGIVSLAGKTSAHASDMKDPGDDQLEILVNLYTQGKYKEAQNQASQFLEKFSESAKLYNICGAIYQGLGQFDASIEAFNKAVSIEPDFAEAYNNMGNALKDQDKLEEAIDAFKKALLIKHNFAEAYNNMGNALKDQGKLEKALEAYKKAISIKPDFAEAYNNVGITIKSKGNLEEAIEAFKSAVSIKPNYAEAFNNIGFTLKDQGKLEEAIRAYNKAISIKPEYAEAYNNVGTAFQEQGKLEDAIKAYNKAISIRPDYPDAFNNMGVAFKDQGRLDIAIESYEKALAIKPDYAAADMNLNVIKSEAVPRWHIPMMNEDRRNYAYKKAINSAVQKGDVVLDIGTGAGLLSMIAADCGAKEVITCEMSETIAKIAEKIIQKNGFENKIKLVNKNSKNIILGQEIDKKVDILVSEILSSEFVGEGIQTSILDAKKRLLKKNGKMIPQAGSIMIALIENTGKLAKELFVDNALGYNIEDFNSITPNKWLVSLEDEPVLISEPFEAFTFNFSDFENIYTDQKKITLKANKSGSCAGVIQWLKVNLYEEIEYENNPVEMHRSGSVSGWKTPIYRFNKPVNVSKGEPLIVKANLTEDTCWFFL